MRPAQRSFAYGSHAALLFAQGLELAEQGRLDEAALALARGLIADPGSAEGHNNFGLVLQQKGALDDAVASFRRALAIRPTYALALNNLGAALAALGQHEDALEAYDAVLAADPGHASALHNAGSTLATLGRYEEAAERFREALATGPESIGSRLGLAHALRNTGKSSEAMAAYRAVLDLAPDNIDARLPLGLLLHREGHHEESLCHYKLILELAPNSADAWSGQGRVLQEIGRIGAARDSFRQAILAEPDSFLHYLGLANCTRLTADDPAFQAMMRLADRLEELPESERINAHFALGKTLADVGRHAEAFGHILAANAQRRQGLDYDEPLALRYLQRIKDTWTPEHLARWTTASDSDAPIFIVGMPRSGSTLVEQILAAHPNVACAGESFAFRDALNAHGLDPADRNPLRSATVPSSQKAQAIAATYLRLAAVAAGAEDRSVSRVTDKMLSNFRYLGLITRLFPRAKIIHTFRDPIESCLSSFRINFESQPFAFDLGELGRYYRAYAILMGHWRRILPPGTIFDVRYEAVAQDFEVSARAIVAHCGLAWNDACLRFHEVQRPIKTASVEQVRRPIYRTSIRTWRPDTATLKPLLDGLGMTQTE